MMDIPKTIAFELKDIQEKLKLAIHTHQIMWFKHKSDPDNCAISEDLRGVEGHIVSLGKKQNLLMSWLRRELSSAPAVVTEAVAGYLGFGAQQCCPSSYTRKTTKKCYPESTVKIKKNAKVVPAVENPGRCHNYKRQSSNGRKSSSGPKKKIEDRGCKNAEEDLPSDLKSISPISTPRRDFESLPAGQSPAEEVVVSHSGAECMAEKQRFMSALGLVTCEVSKELQNRRVERKRRSTANHTQFVYGDTWDIPVKKRKKSNYLTTNVKHITRQRGKVRNGATDNSRTSPEEQRTSGRLMGSHVSASPVDEKLPLSLNPTTYVPDEERVPSVDACSTGQLQTPAKPAAKPSVKPTTGPEKDTLVQSCAIYQETGSSVICHIGNKDDHLLRGREREKCLSSGMKMLSVEGCLAEKRRLLKINAQLNAETKELTTQASKLGVSLATQDSQRRGLLNTEESLRKKIQHIHDFIATMKSSPSSSS